MANEPPESDSTTPTNGSRPGSGLAGMLVGRYRLGSQIGSGGQGAVYLAEDTELRRRVAVKLLTRHATFGVSDQARLRLLREAETASKLDHPCICTVYELGEHEGVPFMAMRYVEGVTLAEWIAGASADGHSDSTTTFVGVREDPGEDEPIPAASDVTTVRREVEEVVRFIERTARALHDAHEAGLIHRDIKPGNIMVAASDGRPVILDFGIARDEESDAPTLTRTGDLVGTPAYMSPEQLMAQRVPLDRRSDVYSLGVTLYEALTLRCPFEEATRAALYQAILTREPPRPRTLEPSISRDLEVILLTALEKDPDDRYQTALELAEDLRRCVDFEPIHARPAGPIVRLKRWAQRSPVTVALTTILFLLLLGGVIWTTLKNLEVRRALVEKDAALTKEREALADYLRMSDVKRLRDAKAAAAGFFPPHPDLVPRLEAWQEKYRETFESLPSHRAALLSLREVALAYTDVERRNDHAEAFADIAALERELKQAEADSKLGDRTSERLEDRLLEIEDRLEELRRAVSVRASWTFAGDDLAFKHETLTQLVADLEAESGPAGAWAEVAKLLEVSRSIKAETVDSYATEWSETTDGIATSPVYGGLRITPQIGLIPLGADPSSGLFEFLHWLSHRAGAPLPSRDTRGRFEMNASTGMILVLLPGGEFLMGAQSTDVTAPNHDPDAERTEGPVHRVALGAYLLGKHEVTQAQWERLTGMTPSRFAPGQTWGKHETTSSHPVEQVTWTEAMTATRRFGLTLPTEAQWEFGCRAGTGTIWSCGNDRGALALHANLADAFLRQNAGNRAWLYDDELNDGRSVHAPVGTYAPNGFGLFDVHGNVREWCRDEVRLYSADNVGSGDGLREGAGPTIRVIRGGGYNYHPSHARSAKRDHAEPGLSHNNLGLRVAAALDE